MPSERKYRFDTIDTPLWEFAPLVDWGDPALNDHGALGFSLLPRAVDTLMLENARTLLVARFRGLGFLARLLTGKMVVAPRRTAAPPAFAVTRSAAQTQAEIEVPAGFYGLRNAEQREGQATLALSFAVSQQAPMVCWQLTLTNRNRLPLQVESVTLFRVGPPHPVRPHRRTDFHPARFRLFKLRRSPKAHSAYYDLTERFGSLRMHALEAPPLEVDASENMLYAAATMPQFAPEYAVMLHTQGRQQGMLLAVEKPVPPGRFAFEANTDRFSPGFTLRWTPASLIVPPGERVTLPKVALYWVNIAKAGRKTPTDLTD